MKWKQFIFSFLTFLLYCMRVITVVSKIYKPKMKEPILSNCERNFILRAAQELKRLDGRNLQEFRTLKVHFGQEWGLCYVSLGETKVLTQVTCEIQEPKTTRPNEGLLFINVELSSMAAPHFEPGRVSDLSVHINRLLEKCIKDSRAIDLESLCIVAEEKVWALKVDVNILNHEGSLVDCASVSALAALSHFKRPDVTTDGEKIMVHNVSERDPIPIVLHHYPVCVSFALLNNSENIFADPTAIEERVSDASLTFGINAYREICCLHLGGTALTKPKLILTCSIKAANRAKEIVNIIKEALKNDAEARHSKTYTGFVDSFEWNKITAMSGEKLKIRLNKYTLKKYSSISMNTTLDPNSETKGNFVIVNLGENCAELSTTSNCNFQKNDSNDVGPPPRKFFKKGIDNVPERLLDSYGEGGSSKWEENLKIPNVSTDSDSCSDPEKEICEIPVQPKQIESIELSGDSEEDEVIILNKCSAIGNSQNIRKTSRKDISFEVERSNSKRSNNSPPSKPRRNKKKKGKK